MLALGIKSCTRSFTRLAPQFKIVTTPKRTRTQSMGETSAPKRRSTSPEKWTYGVAKNGNTMKIDLTKTELDICNLLNNVSDYIASRRPDFPRIEVRIAGGWVRDKLLGDQCHDLDVAVNSMMGYEFATYINEYLKSIGAPTKGIAKIESNPAKSKHLETATTRLYGLEVDFANLRTEVYDENSRIPSQITFGTPKDDAYRRDITINSLFYNVDTRKVEDFTEKGLEDLQAGLIRTPLPPFETFKDDPLRVLRCVRFASRFGFELVSELAEAAKNPIISEALNSKISRERVLSEVEKMITGPSPLKAVQLLYSLNLYNIVFQPPTLVSGSISDPQIAVSAVGAAQWLLTHVADFQTTAPNDVRLINYSSCALPFLGATCELKGKEVPAVQIMLRDSLKAPNADITNVSTVFKGIPMFQQAANDNVSQSVSRSELGMIIRDMGARWESALKMACINELLQALPSLPWDKPDEIVDGTAQQIASKYVDLHKKAVEYDITKCYEWKYLINGKKVAELLGIKPGPVLADILKTLIIWQLDHPNGTEAECTEMLKSYWQEKQANQ